MKRRALLLAASLSAAALSACGGSGVSPSTALAPDLRPQVACSLTTYEWNGVCNGLLLDRSGVNVPLRENKGYTLTYNVPPNGIPINVGVTIGDATLNQIGPNSNGHAFPALKNSAAGTAFLYMFVEDTHSVAAFSLSGPETIAISSASGFPGKACSLWKLVAGTWKSRGAFTASGNQLTLRIAKAGSKTGKTVAGFTYYGFACK